MTYQEIICDANTLYEAYLKSVKSSKWKESTQKFMLNYLRQIFALQEELLNMTYRPSPEGEFTLSERGKIRPITSLIPKDRIVRHVLCDEILMPKVEKKLIYDNGASIKGKGISFARKRFETHLHRYYTHYRTNEGYILFGDFRKFYDNIPHAIAKEDLLTLVSHHPYVSWLLDVIFANFEIDVSYMNEEQYARCMDEVFSKLDYREIPKELLTGERFMAKSINIGDQLSQIIGVFYPYPIDNYVKYVRSQHYYGRYMDDWYIINPSKEELLDILEGIKKIAESRGIHIHDKKTHIVKLSGVYKYLQVRYSLTSTGRVIKRINPKRVTAMRRKLKKLVVKVQNGETSYENVESMFRSWMGGFYKIMSRQQRLELLKLYEELYHKRIEVVNGKLVISDDGEGRDADVWGDYRADSDTPSAFGFLRDIVRNGLRIQQVYDKVPQ